MKNEDTGRFYIHAIDKNGKKRIFCIEPIEPTIEINTMPSPIYDEDWYQNIFDKRKKKHRGSIKERDSIITKENGFENIQYDQNPFDIIEKLLNDD